MTNSSTNRLTAVLALVIAASTGVTYVQLDGYYRAANALDNLIYRGELPVIIAAFIDPGKFTECATQGRVGGERL
jgi:hypothetical protein